MIYSTINPMLLGLIFLLAITACKSQDPVKEKLVSTKRLKSNEVTAAIKVDSNDVDPYFQGDNLIQSVSGPKAITRNIFQDSQGRIWLATWDGIMEYDGDYFINHTNREGLRRYRAFDILEDRSGVIWFACIGAGLYRYDGQRFTNLTMEDGLINNSVQSIYRDTQDHIWIGTQDGISIYDGKTFKNIKLPGDQYNNDINSFAQLGKEIWIGTRGEAHIYDGEKIIKILRSDGYPFINVRCIIIDQKEQFWLAGNDGLWKYDGEQYELYNAEFTGYVYEDHSGNIWTSSIQGSMNNWILSVYDQGQRNQFKIYRPQTNMTFDIVEDDQEHLWIGSGNGPILFDGEQFKYF